MNLDVKVDVQRSLNLLVPFQDELFMVHIQNYTSIFRVVTNVVLKEEIKLKTSYSIELGLFQFKILKHE